MAAGIIKAGYYSLLLCILGMLAAGTAVLWWYNYDTFTLLVAQSSGKMSVLPMVRSRFFTPSKFEFARIAVVVLLTAYLLVLPILVKKVNAATSAVVQLGRQTGLFLSAWLKLAWPSKTGERFCFVMLLLLLLGKTVYYLHYPIQYDEAWTYNYFLSGNLLVALAVYNNHPLYVVLAWFFGFLPFDAAVNMRLPVVVFGFLSVLAIIGFLRYFFSYSVALAATAFFAFSGPVTFYMLYARGYMLLTFFVIASVYCMFRMLEIAKRGIQPYIWHQWQYLYAVSCALGFYSMPTFIYPFTALILYAVLSAFRFKNEVLFGRMFALHILAVVFALLLYMPMLLGTGLKLGAEAATDAHSRQWVWQHVMHYVSRCWYFMFGTAFSLWMPAVAAVLIAVFYRFANNVQQKLTLFSVLNIGIILFSYLLQRVYIPERVWSYQMVFVTSLVALAVNGLYNYLPARTKNTGMVFVAGIFITVNAYLAHSNDFVNWSLPRDTNSRHIAAILMQQNVQRCYLNFDYYKPLLEFYCKTAHKPLKIVMGNPNSVDYAPFNPAAKPYDAIIWDNCAEPLPPEIQTTCQTVFTDEEIAVWLCKR